MQDHASYVYVQLQFGYIVFCNQQLIFRYLLYSILTLRETYLGLVQGLFILFG